MTGKVNIDCSKTKLASDSVKNIAAAAAAAADDDDDDDDDDDEAL